MKDPRVWRLRRSSSQSEWTRSYSCVRGVVPALVIATGSEAMFALADCERDCPPKSGLRCTSLRMAEVEATVRADPAQFEGALTELAAGQRVQLSAAAEGVRLLNLALLNPQPLAQAVLAISAVEALGQDEEWTDGQTALLAQLAAQVEAGTSGQDDERMEIADALRRGLHRFGLRQGVMRVLARLGLQHLRKEWDRVYGIRSGLFHGTAQLAEHEIAELANSAITLCGRIILTLAEGDGVTLPSVSDVHFPRAYG